MLEATKNLIAIPVYNEAKTLLQVLHEVQKYAREILVVDDGSIDGSRELLRAMNNIHLIEHPQNRGYGAALQSAFAFAIDNNYDILVTMDCDGQHEPHRIPVLLEAMHDCEIVSGSRYLRDFKQNDPAPMERSNINALITSEVNERFGFSITDAFCGFKAYSVAALAQLEITENGWGMPLQLWGQAACHGFRIKEVAIPRLYLDPSRAFGGVLSDPTQRLAYYRSILNQFARNYCGQK